MIIRLVQMSLVSVCVLFSVELVFGATMYAKKNGVNVTTQKSPLSSVVATLNRGDAVQVIGESGRHAKVRVGSGKVGWVFKFKLSQKKIGGKSGRSALSILSGEEQIAAREARSGGSIRGLKEVSETYSKNKNISPAHKEAVDRMEALDISPKELLKFQQDGKVGEFAGGEE